MMTEHLADHIKPPDFSFTSSTERPERLIQWANGQLHELFTLAPGKNGKPERFQRIGDIFWEAVKSEWECFDAIDHAEFARLFEAFRPAWKADEAVLSLPPKVTAYRGQSHPDVYFEHLHENWGLSWTTDPEVAKGFARGHRFIRNPEPVIIELELSRDEIAFCCNERQEKEVVVFAPPDPVSYRLSPVEVD